MRPQLIPLLLTLFVLSFTSSAQTDLEVTPNPFEQEFYCIASPHCGDSLVLEIYDRWGKTLQHIEVKQVTAPDTFRYEMDLKEGMYIVRYSQNETTEGRRIISLQSNNPAYLNLVISDKNLKCDEANFEIFPNPTADGMLRIQNHNLSIDYQLVIFDSSGKLILNERVDQRAESDHTVDLQQRRNGVYYLQITTTEEVLTERILLIR